MTEAGDKCKVCNHDLEQHPEVALSCDTCNSWHCFTCMGVASEICKSLEGRDTSMIKFISKLCIGKSFPINVCKSMSEMKQEISDLSENIKAFKLETLNKAEESITAINTHKAAAKMSWSNIVSMGLESSKAIVCVQDTIKASAKTQIEGLEKDRSIIMFRLPESTKENNADRKKEDNGYIEKFITKGLNIQAQPVENSYRLGIYDANKCRPIKIVFTQKAGQVKIIENLSALTNADPEYQRVNISLDRDENERQVVRDMITQAKQQTEASATKKYVVRGLAKPYIHELAKA